MSHVTSYDFTLEYVTSPLRTCSTNTLTGATDNLDGMNSTHDYGYQHPFIDGSMFTYGVGEDPRTVYELAMTRLSAIFRSRENWWEEFCNPTTREKWAEEASKMRLEAGEVMSVTLETHQIEYVLDELSGYASLRDNETGIQVSCFDRIWECQIQPDNTGTLLSLKHIDHLREHSLPQANLDILVNPFRHSYIKGRTLLRPESTAVEPISDPDDLVYSPNFSSLPSIVSVYPMDSRAEYKTYINGLDPQLSDIHLALQNLLGRCIKLFENVLTSLHRSNPLPHRIQGCYYYTPWEEDSESNGEEAWVDDLLTNVAFPDIPSEGFKKESLEFKHRVLFSEGQSIQIVHRIVDIHLDKERNKTYDSFWHVAGTKNERIVACALHFVSVEGIEDAHLNFRMAVTRLPAGLLEDDVAVFRTWGLEDGRPCNQFIGSVPLRTGLTIAFPNVYQHRMCDVRLREDCDKGRLTLVEFYLVDPDIPPIISTADVAPQQSSWIYRSLDSSIDRRLPHEVLERIIYFVESVLTEEEASNYHQEMLKHMEEFTRANNMRFFELPFELP